MEIQPLKLFLLLTNFSTLIFLVRLMVDHYRAKNDLTSWGSLFHMFSFLWLSLRGMFWFWTIASSTPWGAWTFYLLYWMPTPLEFGALMLLPFYFAQVIYSDGWKWHWGQWGQIAYTGFILSLIIFQAVWAVVEAIQKSQEDNDYQTEFKSEVFRIATAACFLVLTISQSIYGVQLLYLDKQRYDRFFMTSREVMAGVNVLLVLSFFSRCVYQLLALAHLYTMPVINLMGTADVPLTTFILHEFWNYVPFYLIVISITSQSFGSTSAKEPSHQYYQAATDEEDSDIEDPFIDMHRYDTPSHSPVFRMPKTTNEVKTPDYERRKTSNERVPPLSSVPQKHTWLSDSDPQSYCLAAVAAADKNLADLIIKAGLQAQNFPADSRNHNRSVSGTTSVSGGVSSKDSFDETSILQVQRVKWLAHYYDTHVLQKRRSGSEGSLYGGLSGLELSRFHLFLNESNVSDFGNSNTAAKIAQSKPKSRETHASNSLSTPMHKPLASTLAGNIAMKGGLPIGHNHSSQSTSNHPLPTATNQVNEQDAKHQESKSPSQLLSQHNTPTINYREDIKHHTPSMPPPQQQQHTGPYDISTPSQRFALKPSSNNPQQESSCRRELNTSDVKVSDHAAVIGDEKSFKVQLQSKDTNLPATSTLPSISVLSSSNNPPVVATLPSNVTNPRPKRPSQLPFGFTTPLGVTDGSTCVEVSDKWAATTTPTMVDSKPTRTPSRSDSAQSTNSDRSEGNSNSSFFHSSERRRTPDMKSREKKLLTRRDSEAYI